MAILLVTFSCSVSPPLEAAAPGAPRTTTTVAQAIGRPVVSQYPRIAPRRTMFTVSGSADPLTVVQVRLFAWGGWLRWSFKAEPTVLVDVRADAAGRWEASIPGLQVGSYRAEAQATDRGGAASAVSGSVSVHVGLRPFWLAWDAVGGAFSSFWWLRVLGWAAVAATAVLVWRQVRASGYRPSIGPSPGDTLAEVEAELSLLDHLGRQRPLRLGERRLQSRLRAYRQSLQGAPSTRRVAKKRG